MCSDAKLLFHSQKWMFLSNQGVDLKFLIVVTQGVFACSVADSLCKTDDVLL